jgi:chemotaxis protein CheD
MRKLYLKPGEYYLGDQPARIVTVLGSCVAVSMFHRKSGLAALCHALAPDCGPAADCTNGCAQIYRYVNCMIPAMARAFLTRGIRPMDTETKLFGGAAMINAYSGATPRKSVGAMNIAAARKVIQNFGLILKSADVGGHLGRKIIFDTSTGDVLLKRLGPT